ncbi:hypothetical protein QA601_02930 [Chitinispirillales bacterium ANBcel5]|uniref:DUF7309 domain-containing protein n=1 Tax=Cellulosispirillum alkaliphilum TaxID=3039283 RepID=UPI002A54D869|nr:hypothetical protein [Chitinispirillales bacterium ANBcel5]
MEKLYSLIQKFVQAEPWELFESEDVFFVQSPADGIMYLCSVMGNGGEEFGINAFRGAQGMRNFEKMLDHDPEGPMDRNLMFELDMLAINLCTRDYMDKKDLKITKNLMLTFRGGEWPLIRSYRPHYYPYFLTETEIEALCDCLQQILELYEEGEMAVEQIRTLAPGEMVVRCKEDSSWISRIVNIGYATKEDIPEIHLDDSTIKRLLSLPASGLNEMIDLVHLPAVIEDPAPPHYGLMLLGIDPQNIANEYGLFQPFQDYLQESCEKIVQAFLARGSKPGFILLREDSPLADCFETIAKLVDIKFEKVDELLFISEFLDSMESTMS